MCVGGGGGGEGAEVLSTFIGPSIGSASIPYETSGLGHPKNGRYFNHTQNNMGNMETFL